MESLCERYEVHLPIINKSLHKAAQRGDRTCLQTLIEAGADVNSTTYGGKTALILASCHYNKNKSCCECVKFLLEAGADVNRKDLKEMFTSLMCATRFGCKHCGASLE